MLPCRRGGRGAFHFINGGLQGFYFRTAHQLADKLHLPAATFVGGDALSLQNRVSETFRHVDFGDPILRQSD